MTGPTFFISEAGSWSGGAKSVLATFHYAAARHPRIRFDAGDFVVMNRNFPNTRHRDPFILVPQNAWAWAGPKDGAVERSKLLAMRAFSEVAMRRAVGVVRVSEAIPAIGRCVPGFVPNVLDPSFDDSLIEAKSLPRPVPGDYFVSVGSLNSYRGLESLISAYDDYRRQGGTTPLHLVGGGTPRYAARIDALLSARAGITRHPGAGRAECLGWLAGARAAILPSHVEASPISLLEALATQATVIASDIPGHPSIVPPGTDGPSYFAHNDLPALTAQLMAADARQSNVAHPLADRDFREGERIRWSDQLLEALDRAADA